MRQPYPTQASVELPSTLEPAALMRAIIEDPLPNMFTRWGPFPAVLRSELASAANWEPGASRTIYTSDGNKVTEEFIHRREGDGFSYRLTGWEGIFGLLIRQVDDIWYFTELRHGSGVLWTWQLHAKSGLRLPVVLLARLWQVYMRRILRATLRRLEAAQGLA